MPLTIYAEFDDLVGFSVFEGQRIVFLIEEYVLERGYDGRFVVELRDMSDSIVGILGDMEKAGFECKGRTKAGDYTSNWLFERKARTKAIQLELTEREAEALRVWDWHDVPNGLVRSALNKIQKATGDD